MKMEITKWFAQHVANSACGSPVCECSCGRICYSDSLDYDEGEREELEKQAKKNPQKYFYMDDDAVRSVDVLGQTIVDGCPCERAQHVERKIWAYREELIAYFRARLTDSVNEAAKQLGLVEEAAAADLMFDKVTAAIVGDDDG